MKDFIKKKLNIMVEDVNQSKPNVYGQEGISRKLAELNETKKRLVNDRNKLNKRIKELEEEIALWEKDISPNQISMGLFDY